MLEVAARELYSVGVVRKASNPNRIGRQFCHEWRASCKQVERIVFAVVTLKDMRDRLVTQGLCSLSSGLESSLMFRGGGVNFEA